jgi:hypothetical protein
MNATKNDTNTELCNATPEQWDRFEAAANASGHASGKSAANDGNLWSLTVADAIALVTAKEIPQSVDVDTERQYRIAYRREDGGWDVVETIWKAGDDAANAYANDKYENNEWFVLNEAGQNING